MPNYVSTNKIAMNRPIGLCLVIAWCVLRGIRGIWGTINVGRWVLRGYGTWRDAFVVFALEGAIWFCLALVLLTRWNYGRIVVVLWCDMTIAGATYSFYIAGAPRGFFGRYVLTVTINATTIIYLLRPLMAAVFK